MGSGSDVCRPHLAATGTGCVDPFDEVDQVSRWVLGVMCAGRT